MSSPSGEGSWHKRQGKTDDKRMFCLSFVTEGIKPIGGYYPQTYFY